MNETVILEGPAPEETNLWKMTSFFGGEPAPGMQEVSAREREATTGYRAREALSESAARAGAGAAAAVLLSAAASVVSLSQSS